MPSHTLVCTVECSISLERPAYSARCFAHFFVPLFCGITIHHWAVSVCGKMQFLVHNLEPHCHGKCECDGKEETDAKSHAISFLGLISSK
jgi:hypothetical protein